MRKFFTVAAVALLVSAGAFAQSTTASDSISVTATVQGIFTLSIISSQDAANPGSFDFGTVDASGTQALATGVSKSTVGGATTYTSSGITWECYSAPQRDVSIALSSTSANATIPATADPDILSVNIPQMGTTYSAFTSAANLWTSSTKVGNGTNYAHGDLNLKLLVGDTTPIGDYTWVVNLTATGTL